MIVLDANAISSAFNPKSSDHGDFAPVYDWVVSPKNDACFVFGGTKYQKELLKMGSYLKIISLLKTSRNAVEINTKLVDARAVQLKKECPDAAFNDEHIVAILDVSGCKLVGTKDEEAMPYIKNRDFYSDKKPPKVYSSAKNKDLLTRGNVVSLRHVC